MFDRLPGNIEAVPDVRAGRTVRQRDNDNILRHNLFAERGLDCLIAIGDVTAQGMLELRDADDRLRNVGTVNDDIIGEVFADTIDRLSVNTVGEVVSYRLQVLVHTASSALAELFTAFQRRLFVGLLYTSGAPENPGGGAGFDVTYPSVSRATNIGF